MNRLPMSSAAAGLLRALLARAQISRDRILLTEIRSADWQSLTLVGERHEMHFTIPGPDAAAIAARMTDGIEEAEFAISGQIVADIGLGGLETAVDGSIEIAIEALTVEE
jgi:hypothetical protein